MAARAIELALEQLLCAIGDPVGTLRRVSAGQPEFARAQCLIAGAAVLAKTPTALPEIAQVLAALDGQRLPSRERQHLAAAADWLRGEPLVAAERYAELALGTPRDSWALRLAQSCFFFCGEHERSRQLADQTLRTRRHRQRDHRFVLAMAAFVHAEAGDAAYGERLGRAALRHDPACPMGVHAVANAIDEQHGPAPGAHWLRAQRAHWAVASRMRTHNAWHLAMFDVATGRTESGLGILDNCLLPAAERGPLDACDAAALLWRIAQEGIDVGSRWARLSDAFARTWQPGFWPQVDLYAALTHWAAGRLHRARRLTVAVRSQAVQPNYIGRRAREVTLPGLAALRAWAGGRRSEMAAQIPAFRSLLSRAGGSRPQLELFVNLTSGSPPSPRPAELTLRRTSPATLHTPTC